MRIFAISVLILFLGCTTEGVIESPGSDRTMLPTATETSESAPSEKYSNSGANSKPSTELPAIRFFRNEIFIATLPVEVPPASAYSIGLSGRDTLGEQGMLFWFVEETEAPFWMVDTLFDLSIAWIGSDKSILAIDSMYAKTALYHHPPAPYLYALEAPLDWYQQNGVEPGDRIEFPPDILRILLNGK